VTILRLLLVMSPVVATAIVVEAVSVVPTVVVVVT
jgi:hypothetical protein